MEFTSKQTDIFNSEIAKLKKDLVKKYDELGMRASGKFERELDYVIESSTSTLKATIFGAGYTEQLVQGREPGRFPPIDSIKQWILDKPITPQDNISIDSLAFLIARKIATEGTDYYIQGGTDLIEAIFTPERIRSIIEALGASMLTDFRIEVNELLKR